MGSRWIKWLIIFGFGLGALWTLVVWFIIPLSPVAFSGPFSIVAFGLSGLVWSALVLELYNKSGDAAADLEEVQRRKNDND